jgi:hypothetical protein
MNEDKLIRKLLEHDDRLDRIERNMASKDDVRRMTDLLEGIATICKNIQEEHTFAVEWVKRLQTQVERQEEDIRQIKLRLQIV